MPDIFVAEPNKEKIGEKRQEPILHQHGKHTKKHSEISDNKGFHLFSSFSRFPKDMSFENQEEGEKILFFVRKHFITNLPWVVSGILLLTLPFFIGIFASFLQIPLSLLPDRYYLFFAAFYYLLIGSYIFVNFITWYFNIAFVTNIRVIDVDFTGLVYKNIAATKINLVQDVSYDQIGVLRTLFDYGDVLVQTAGSLENFIFEAVPRPESIVHLVGDIIGKEKNA